MAKLTTYYRLLKQLKKKCGGRSPTQFEIEQAMDDMRLPDDFEIDVEKLILDLSTFVYKKDAETDTIKRVTKKYDKMALAAASLTTIQEDDVMKHHDRDETLRQENESLMNRLAEIAERCPSR